MSKRNIAIIALVIVVIVAVVATFMWVNQAPTEENLEGLSTELEDAGEPTMQPGPEDPPPPEPSNTPPG